MEPTTDNHPTNNQPTNDEPVITKELMDQWLRLIHRATAKKLISFRQRMQLLWLYAAVEKKLGLPDSSQPQVHPTTSAKNP